MVLSREMMELIEARMPAGAEVRFGERMGEHTSLRIGGRADVYIRPADREALASVVRMLMGIGMPFMSLGGGTNILVSDDGMEGAVVDMGGIKYATVVDESEAEIAIDAGAGYPLQELVALTRRIGASGIEGLAGIPGTVGGAVAGNAGSFGAEMADVLVEATVMGPHGGCRIMKKAELKPAYRSMSVPEDSVIVSALMRFRRGQPEAIGARVAECLKKKKESQPIGQWSAGCVFKNPQGDYAGRLIEASGCKGMREGDIEVSALHANFFVNTGIGLSADFVELMKSVTESVRGTFGVVLEPEIRMVGRWRPESEE